MSTNISNFVRKGCEFIKSAVKNDNEENYTEALSLYSKGIQYLMTGLKYEKHQKVKSAIKEKVQKYLNRAEEIKSGLDAKTIKSKKKKKKYKYPTQQKIIDAISKSTDDTIHLVYGYTRSTENILNISYSIPEGIVQLCIVYYHILPDSKKYTTDPTKYIADARPNIKWDDVAGLTDAKQKLKEFVILPLKFPALFAGKRRYTGRNILLYGPPGTGKSFLTKAVATETSNTQFFNIAACDLCCKYQGDSERMIKNIFAMAQESRPSIMCFDEIDSLSPRRGSSEYVRRRSTEFLVQMQGTSHSQIVVIGITNCPWDLNPAVRRRFTKRIYCGLPDQEARQKMFRIHVGDSPNRLSEEDYVRLGQMTEGFSGGDISGAVQDTLMEPVRDLQNATHFKKVVQSNDENDFKWMICDAVDNDAIQMGLMDIPTDEQDKLFVEPLQMKHFLVILERCRPSVSTDDTQRYIEWRNEFGEEE